jgi:hypothetical protein
MLVMAIKLDSGKTIDFALVHWQFGIGMYTL